MVAHLEQQKSQKVILRSSTLTSMIQNLLRKSTAVQNTNTKFTSLGLFWYVASGLDNFVIGLTNDDPATKTPVFKKSYAVCAQFKGTVPAGAQANVRCAWRHRRAPEIFRYVIVQGSHATPKALCLTEVYVHASTRRGK